MYKAIYKFQTENIDKSSQEIFSPFINCYHIHSVTIYINGMAQEQETDFNFNRFKTNFTGGFTVDQKDNIIFDINYFYIRPDDIDVLGFLTNDTFSNILKSKEIISKHYIEGQFSLDNGLYKNAVLNFGTTLEGILNKNLSNKPLNKLIDSYNGYADKSYMNDIKNMRNKVHPNRISKNEDISRNDAINARNKLEIIINKIYSENVEIIDFANQPMII